MTTRRCLIICLATLAIAGYTVRGQGIGLQVADTADGRIAGETEYAAGVVFGDNLSSSAARAMFAIEDDLRAFFDLGWVEPDGAGDGNLCLQAGALYALPVDYPSNLGLRGAGYFVDTDSLDIIGCNLMVLSSGETIVDGLHLYGGIGADLAERKTERRGSGHSDRGELNPALTLGALYFVTSHVSVYVEASHVDEAMIGAGIRYR